MFACSWLLSVCLVGQVSRIPPPPIDIPPPATSPAKSISGDESARSTGFSRNPTDRPSEVGKAIGANPANNSARATSDQLVADALALPIDGSITGRPISLLTAVAAVRDRARQLEAVHAYWRLAEAIGDYRYCFERQQRLARLKAASDEAADLRTAQAIAVAQLHDAELQTTSAQQDLAAKLDFPETAPLPLPADRPLTEAYRTRFAELFAGRKTPDRLRMLDQTLPLRQRAVESHAAAVLAAEEALDAAIELQGGGRAQLAGVLHALDAQIREQRAFIAAVCRYNDDIVDYSLAVIPQQTSPAVLVSTLIKQARPIAEASPDSANIPAQFQQAITIPAVRAPDSAGSLPPSRLRAELNPPALIAPPAAEASIPKPPQPLFQAPPAAIPQAPPVAMPVSPPAAPDAPATPVTPPQNREDQAPSLAPPQELTIPQSAPQAGEEKQPAGARSTGFSRNPGEMPPEGGTTSTSTVRTTFKPVVESEPRDNAMQLAAALFAGNSSVAAGAQPLRLVDCLRSAAPNRRLSAITAYWHAAHEAAIVELYVNEQQWLDGLKPALAAQNPPSPTGMLNLRSARTAVDARLLDAQADRLAAEFELAITAGLTTDKSPAMPTSTPFAGHFPLALAAGKSWTVRQIEAEIAGQERAVSDHAAAVTESDAARAASTADFLSGRKSFEHALATIDVQSIETATLIDSMSDYNQMIAKYVVGNSTPIKTAETLSEALMVPQ